MCAGYAQANLVILPKQYADDFKIFASKNPKPCPILEIVEGTPDVHDMGEGAIITSDIPKYRIWKNGVNIDPLKVPQEPAEPIKKENKDAFEQIRDRIVAELNGTATLDMIVTQLDSLAVAAADSTKVEKAEK
jgi:uncharacterized protein YcsI (UPF0317 family)